MTPLIKNNIYILLLTLFSLSSNAQILSNIDRYVQGHWKIVLHDYRGYEKFSPSQAKQIEKSDLIITGNYYYYENVDFVDTCKFSKWRIIQLDSLSYADVYGLSLPYKYPLNELRKFVRLEPVQENGCFTCYNECNLFFLKKDTLINICGGYTYYLIKDAPKDKTKNYPK